MEELTVRTLIDQDRAWDWDHKRMRVVLIVDLGAVWGVISS